jgi:hypothetical protein
VQASQNFSQLISIRKFNTETPNVYVCDLLTPPKIPKT